MKKIMLCALVTLATLLFASCVFKGTATFDVHNDSGYTMTAVKLNTENHPCNVASGNSFWIYNVDPGTYAVVASFSGHADYTIEASQVVEEGTVYIRTIPSLLP